MPDLWSEAKNLLQNINVSNVYVVYSHSLKHLVGRNLFIYTFKKPLTLFQNLKLY